MPLLAHDLCAADFPISTDPHHPDPLTQRPTTPNTNNKPTNDAVHFWAPTFKWGITIANIADLQRPADKVSYPQQLAVTATGVIWSRYSTQITPVNYNLLAVNFFMALSGSYQLARKLRHDYGGGSGGDAAGAKAAAA